MTATDHEHQQDPGQPQPPNYGYRQPSPPYYGPPPQYPQGPPPMPEYPGPTRYTQGPKNGLGVASFVLGIIAVALSWIPIFNLFAMLPVALVGLGTGLGGVYRLNKGAADNKALTWIGTGLSILGIVLVIVFYAAFAASLNGS